MTPRALETEPQRNPFSQVATGVIRERVKLSKIVDRLVPAGATASQKQQLRNRFHAKRASFSVEFLGELVTACPELRAVTLGELFQLSKEGKAHE